MTSTQPKVAVVIGGAGGIGQAIVHLYASYGFAVIVGDKDTNNGFKAAQRSNGIFFPIDVLDELQIIDFQKNVADKYGCVSRLISLAGAANLEEFRGLEHCSTTAINESIHLNLVSHLHLIKILFPLLQMNESGNTSVTLISSVNAIRDFGLPAYSAAKAGLLGIVHSLSQELGSRDIRINSVLPGTVLTAKTMDEPKNFETLKSFTVLNRFPTTQEIAATVYALTEFMTCVTGQNIVADCGQTISGQNEMFSITK